MQQAIERYADALRASGAKVFPSESGTFWVSYEQGSMVRMPTFCLTPPAAEEIKRVFQGAKMAVVSYICEPDATRPANALLYTCSDAHYNLENLSKSARRNARLALRRLKIGFIDWPSVIEHGLQAYADTRQRAGLSDVTKDAFHKRFMNFSQNPFHHVIGAWQEDEGVLAAFLTVAVVNDWVEAIGPYSANAYLKYHPNDGLIHYALDHFLVQKGLKIVSYGVSSVQTDSNKAGLHDFKTRVGFRPQPVYRAFLFHPLLRPLANKLTLWCLKVALRLRPGSRLLRKAIGSVEAAVG